MAMRAPIIAVVTLFFGVTAFAARNERSAKAKTRRPAPAAARKLRPTRSASSDVAELAGLFRQFLGSRAMANGSTQAHAFMEDVAEIQLRAFGQGGPTETADRILMRPRVVTRKYKAPSNDGSVIMQFPDGSGVYVFENGDAVILREGQNIADMVAPLEEFKGR